MDFTTEDFLRSVLFSFPPTLTLFHEALLAELMELKQMCIPARSLPSQLSNNTRC